VGFSLGANILLKWLGEQGDSLDINGAAAVSVPFRLDHCADHMNTGFARTYQFRLVRHMRRCVQQRLKMFERSGKTEQARRLNDLGDLRGAWSFRTIDHHLTAPLHGYKSADHYYQRCSSGFFLKKIRKPVLIIQAKDDPFMPASAIPGAEQLSQSTILELSRGGGHIGFIGGHKPWQPEYYLDQRIPAWFQGFAD
nr:hydrolase [Gammaproteobacteria bacterium]